MEATTAILACMLNEPPEGEKAFALVDATLHPDIAIRPMLGVELTALPVPGVNDKRARALMPILLAWPEDSGMQRWLLPRSVRWASEHHGVTWLRSKLPLPDLAKHLGTCMSGQLDDGRRMLLRFSDARALPAIAAHLDAGQRSVLFGPIEHWWHLNRRHELRELAMGDRSTAQPPSPPLPLRLTEAQLAALIDAAEPDIVMRLVSELSPQTLRAMPPAERHAFIVQCIATARDWGMQASLDFAHFCAQVLENGPAFNQSPQWPSLVEQVKAGRMTWAEAISGRPDEASAS